MSRPSWDDYFLRLAVATASRSTCDRKHVGAVLVVRGGLVSTGYNGSVRGLPHCDDEGHLMEEGHCTRVIHAEVNAVVSAARLGVAVEGATLYCTAFPCWPCAKVLLQAGTARIVYAEGYRPDPRVTDACLLSGVVLEQWKLGSYESSPNHVGAEEEKDPFEWTPSL